jgi:predicted lactoylglutathione lyase
LGSACLKRCGLFYPYNKGKRQWACEPIFVLQRSTRKEKDSSMTHRFPGAVPEIPVSDVDEAAAYYVSLGFTKDWGDDAGGIAGISRGECRMFLTNNGFREMYDTHGPVVIWLNLNSKAEVDEVYRDWHNRQAKLISPPESKPWKLHEFTAADLDGNLFRVFFDLRQDL